MRVKHIFYVMTVCFSSWRLFNPRDLADIIASILIIVGVILLLKDEA